MWPFADKVCTRCYAVNKIRTETSGSLVVELFLWLLLIIPGVMYSLWRMASKHRVCSECGSGDIVKVDSPRGKQIMARIVY